MKLTTVVASVNDNPKYYNFIPLQIQFWSKFGIKFIAIFAGENLPKEIKQYEKNIILWKKNKDLRKAFIGQNIRIYYPALLKLPDDECVMITDMDMLPASDKYFKSGVEKYDKKFFVHYPIPLEGQLLMCYNAAHPSTWAKVFNIYSENDIEKRLKETYVDGYNGKPRCSGWYKDQEIMNSSLRKYENLVILNKIANRLEMRDYKKKLENNETNFVKNYDDIHFHRSFTDNEELINNAKKQLFN